MCTRAHTNLVLQVLRLAEAHIKHEREELKSLAIVLDRNKQVSCVKPVHVFSPIPHRHLCHQHPSLSLAHAPELFFASSSPCIQDSDQRYMALEARMRATDKDKQVNAHVGLHACAVRYPVINLPHPRNLGNCVPRNSTCAYTGSVSRSERSKLRSTMSGSAALAHRTLSRRPTPMSRLEPDISPHASLSSLSPSLPSFLHPPVPAPSLSRHSLYCLSCLFP